MGKVQDPPFWVVAVTPIPWVGVYRGPEPGPGNHVHGPPGPKMVFPSAACVQRARGGPVAFFLATSPLGLFRRERRTLPCGQTPCNKPPGVLGRGPGGGPEVCVWTGGAKETCASPGAIEGPVKPADRAVDDRWAAETTNVPPSATKVVVGFVLDLATEPVPAASKVKSTRTPFFTPFSVS
ncbi:unnamed protein product [Coregonus sp. 'balchen']|nr:unnamed protein product [Coregonus sp. 'balchen']